METAESARCTQAANLIHDLCKSDTELRCVRCKRVKLSLFLGHKMRLRGHNQLKFSDCVPISQVSTPGCVEGDPLMTTESEIRDLGD